MCCAQGMGLLTRGAKTTSKRQGALFDKLIEGGGGMRYNFFAQQLPQAARLALAQVPPPPLACEKPHPVFCASPTLHQPHPLHPLLMPGPNFQRPFSVTLVV